MLNIKVNRNKFLKSLRIVDKAVKDNKIKPVLSGVSLSAKDDKIFLMGTDLELTINAFMFGKIITEGEIVFSANLVDEYLKEIDDEEIQLVEGNGSLIIETENSSSEFTIMDSSEYPKLKEVEDGTTYEISKEQLEDMLEKVKFAAAQTSENLAINCVRFELVDGKIKMIATDTFRLVYLENEFEDAAFGELKFSLPLSSVEALLKTLKSVPDEFVKFKFSGSQICFDFEKVNLFSRVIDLAFPDYAGILARTAYDKNVYIDTDKFCALLKRVLVFVKNNIETKNSALFEFEDGQMLIKGVSENAKINEDIEVNQEGENLRISLNAKYLLDYLVHLENEEKAVIKLLDSNSAVLLKSMASDNFVYLAMPLAIREN